MKELLPLLGMLVCLAGCAPERPWENTAPRGGRVAKAPLEDGPFLFLRTIVDVEAGLGPPGRLPGTILTQATPVRFRFGETEVDVELDAVRPRLTEPGFDPRHLAHFPAEHVDLLPVRDAEGKDTRVEEETKSRNAWNNRKYVVAMFAEDRFDPLAPDTVASRLTEAPHWVDHDVFAFTVRRTMRDGSAVSVRYAFRRMEKDPAPIVRRVYAPSLQRRYGYFPVTEGKPDERGMLRDANIETFAARWPKGSEITLRFHRNFPKWLRAEVKAATGLWNTATEDQVSIPRLRLDEETEAEAGDPKANVVQYYDDNSGAENGLIAVAPLVIDPESSSIRKVDVVLYGSALRRFGSLLASQTDPVAPLKTPPEPLLDWLEEPELPKVVAPPGMLPPNPSLSTLRAAFGTVAPASPVAPSGSALGAAAQASNSCDMRLTPALAAGLGADFLDGETETAIVDAVYRFAILHELGHALGLRHNFYASADKARFPDFQRTTSVEDYLVPHPRERLRPGPYDVDALIQLYGNKPPGPKRYAFCTEPTPQQRQLLAHDPLCDAYDSATSLEEAVEEHSRRARRLRRWHLDRLERARFPVEEATTLRRRASALLPLRLIYEQADAIRELEQRGRYGPLWNVAGQRIEARTAPEEKVRTLNEDQQPLTRPVSVVPRHADSELFVDDKLIRDVSKDAVRARALAIQSLRGFVEEEVAPQADLLDTRSGDVMALGRWRDRALALLLLTLPFSTPQLDADVRSPLSTEQPEVMALWNRLLSGTMPVPQKDPLDRILYWRANDAMWLRYFAVDLLAEEASFKTVNEGIAQAFTAISISRADNAVFDRWRMFDRSVPDIARLDDPLMEQLLRTLIPAPSGIGFASLSPVLLTVGVTERNKLLKELIASGEPESELTAFRNRETAWMQADREILRERNAAWQVVNPPDRAKLNASRKKEGEKREALLLELSGLRRVYVGSEGVELYRVDCGVHPIKRVQPMCHLLRDNLVIAEWSLVVREHTLLVTPPGPYHDRLEAETKTFREYAKLQRTMLTRLLNPRGRPPAR